MKLTDNIQRIRRQKNMSQKELAQRMKVQTASVVNWEQGVNLPTTEGCIKLCHIFKITPNELFVGDYPQEPKKDYRDTLLCKQFRRLRGKAFLTEEQLAEKMGINATVIREIETGICYPGEELILLFCNTLRINPNKLYQFEETENTQGEI